LQFEFQFEFSRLAPLRGFAASLQLTVQSFQFSVFSLSWEFVPDFNLFLCGAAALVLVLRRAAPLVLVLCGAAAPVLVLRCTAPPVLNLVLVLDLVQWRAAPPNLPQIGDTASTTRDRPSLM